MKTFWIGLRAFIFMSGFLLAAAWLVLTVRSLDRSAGWTLPGWLAFTAPLFLLPGAALVLASGGFFVVRGRGTPALFDAPRVFVATGPYRLVRNPMYIGAFLLLTGFALYWGSVAVLLFIPLAFAAAHLLVTLYEEPVLRGKFGASYEAYCHDVNRWLPCAR